ncbi:MAG: glycogen/starch/alpha-glucan phosphorylase, partial [Lachnospiraceae bacterium]|nr:glycogen/starch/alpha-glucan phosphorylase [Lachnospiraceae bacterium]
LNVACAGKVTSDRTIQEYVDEIWKLDKVVLQKETAEPQKKSLLK